MKIIYLLIIGMVLVPIINAEVQTLGIFKKGDTIILSQTCDNCTFINVTRVKYPNSSENYINLGMSETIKGNWNLTFTDTETLGNYLVTTCGNPDLIYTCENYDFKITNNGEEISLFNIILVIAFFIFSILVFMIGSTFKPEQYILKTSFYIIALIFGLLGINSARIIASESLELNLMSLSGLILTITIFLIMVLYVFIYWMIQTFKSVKQKEGVRWQY